MNAAECLFCRIAAGDLTAEVVLESDTLIAFRDINPQAPTHVVIIPKKHIATINALQDEDAGLVGELFLAARDIAATEGFAEQGYRIAMNCNAAAGQTVFHIHLHLLGGRDFRWPPG